MPISPPVSVWARASRTSWPCWEKWSVRALESTGERRILLDVGIHMKISEKHALVAALGLDLHAGDGQRHHYITAGYQRSIGN